MEISIKQKNDNLFFKRTDLVAEIQQPGKPTPKRDDVKKILAAQFGAPENQVVIKELSTKLNSTTCTAEVYKDIKDLEKYAKKYMVERPKKGTKTAAPKKKAEAK